MTRASFDALITRLAASPTTCSERELLAATHWDLGEDARLREDHRFRQTPWARWMLAEDLVANDESLDGDLDLGGDVGVDGVGVTVISVT